MTRELIKCARCKGTGTRDRDGQPPECPVCQGSGQLFFPIPFVRCGRCDGDGTRDRDGQPPNCPTCQGAGVVAADEIRRF